jgi:phenylglyoxylate dehydrogenase beta subunit
LGKAYKTLVVHPEKCNGCGDCEIACAKEKADSTDISHSRINVIRNLKQEFFGPVVCQQCGEPECVKACPAGALTKNLETGVIAWDGNRCVTCTICTLSCPYGGITYNPVIDNVIKCDHCGGDPECLKVCEPKALEYRTEAELFNKEGELEDLFVPGLSSCLGCNSELIIRHALRHIGPNTVLATPPGCVAGVAAAGFNFQTGSKVPIFHPLLTNSAPMLAGVRRYYQRIGRDVTVMALAGDGATADVGFQSVSGAAERGEQILYLCIDNEGYMNTGMQRSGTTPYGSWTSTTPVGPSLRGKTRDNKYMPLVMVMHNCEYVATASTAFMDDFYRKLDQAYEATQRGMAYLHIFSPCPTGWRFHPNMTIELSRKAVETNMFPLWEYHFQTGELRFTYPIDNPLPLESYLSLVGKFRHLDEAQIEHLKETATQRVEMLLDMSKKKKEAEEVKAAG